MVSAAGSRAAGCCSRRSDDALPTCGGSPPALPTAGPVGQPAASAAAARGNFVAAEDDSAVRGGGDAAPPQVDGGDVQRSLDVRAVEREIQRILNRRKTKCSRAEIALVRQHGIRRYRHSDGHPRP